MENHPNQWVNMRQLVKCGHSHASWDYPTRSGDSLVYGYPFGARPGAFYGTRVGTLSEYAARLFRRCRELRVKVLNHRAEESAKRASHAVGFG